MRPERWQRVEELFHAAERLSDAKRAAFLAEACGGDTDLRARVESLIGAGERSGDFIEETIAASAGMVAPEQTPTAGQRIGPYVVIRELGRGGMGNVYLAERSEEDFQQKVAIKLIRGLYSREMLQRFLAERRILARLNHPNIARLLDGGTTDSGVPYVVMEYVEGDPIDEACDRLELPTQSRIELFRKVCDAVQFAHRNLIVHRDLKPGNVLVTSERVPKLLDFGIAKLLEADPAGSPAAATATAARLLTPEYASPEQILGDPVATASDVYSLGVMLYELLTGRRPYQLKNRDPGTLIRAICEQEIERPSVAVGREDVSAVSRARSSRPEQLRRRLTGDLDNILLMALRKEPDRRYTSAADLAEDLRRHLEGHPVIARSDTWTYRSVKFVRRHKIGVVAGIMIAVLLSTFAVTMGVQAQRIARERDVANLERSKAEQVANFVSEVFRLSDPAEAIGEHITARQLLDGAVARIDSELRDHPEMRASMMHIIGVVYRNLGLYDEADALIAGALAIRRDLFGDDHVDTLATMGELAALRVGQGRESEAEELARRTHEGRSLLLGEEHPDTLRAKIQLALVHQEFSRFPLPTALKTAYEAQSRVLGPDHPDTLRTMVAHVAWMYEESRPILRRALQVQRRTLGTEHPDTLYTMRRLADHYIWFPGDHAEAELLYAEVLEIQQRVLGAEHPDTLTTQNGRILLFTFQGRLVEAEALARDTLEGWRNVVGAEHPRVYRGMRYLANILRNGEQFEEAESLYQATVELQRRWFKGDDSEPLLTLREKSMMYLRQGRLDEARDLARQVLDGWLGMELNDPVLLSKSCVDLACVAAASGDVDEALGLLDQSFERGLVGQVLSRKCLDVLNGNPAYETLRAEALRIAGPDRRVTVRE